MYFYFHLLYSLIYHYISEVIKLHFFLKILIQTTDPVATDRQIQPFNTRSDTVLDIVIRKLHSLYRCSSSTLLHELHHSSPPPFTPSNSFPTLPLRVATISQSPSASVLVAFSSPPLAAIGSPSSCPAGVAYHDVQRSSHQPARTE